MFLAGIRRYMTSPASCSNRLANARLATVARHLSTGAPPATAASTAAMNDVSGKKPTAAPETPLDEVTTTTAHGHGRLLKS